MAIEIVKVFKVPLGSETQIKTLDMGSLTALSIWLVEGVNNPDILPLYFKEIPFIWRVNPEKGESYFKVVGFELPFDFWSAHCLLDEIESLATADMLAEDTYPSWYERQEQDTLNLRFVVKVVDGILAYVDTHEGDKSILPIGLKVCGEEDSYYAVTIANKAKNNIHYEFGK